MASIRERSFSDDRRSSDPERLKREGIVPLDADADDGLQAEKAVELSGLQLDEATASKIRWRADMVVMPILCLIYGIQFLDRTALSYGSVMGMLRDLDLEGQQYSWLGSIFFFSYLGAEFVNGRLLQVFPIGKYLSIATIIWGVIAACYAAAPSYSVLLGLRFLLGVFQACVSPALILIVSQWYTRPEQVTRTAIWLSANGLAQIFGGVVAYGMIEGYLSNHWPLSSWRALFVLFGCLTAAVGLVSLLLLPDSPRSARWLSPDLRNLAVERVRSNQQGIGNRKFKFYQVRELLDDGFAWALLLFSIASNIASGGISNFFNLIVLSFGFTPEQSLLYTAPAGAVAIALTLSWGFIAQRFQCRLLAGMGALLVALLGIVLVVTLPASNPQGRLAGYYLTMGVVAADAAVLSMISTNIAGYTKKTTLSAVYFVIYCAGNIIGPQLFQAQDAPEYHPAEISIIVVLAVAWFSMLGMYLILRRRNALRRDLRHDSAALPGGTEFWDLTDLENPVFVYSL